MNDLIEDYKLVLKNTMDLDLNVNYGDLINKSLNAFSFLYSKFISYKLILIVAFPACNQDELLVLNKKVRE
jgi:hypothetical protein